MDNVLSAGRNAGPYLLLATLAYLSLITWLRTKHESTLKEIDTRRIKIC
jgi:hypothetical protein